MGQERRRPGRTGGGGQRQGCLESNALKVGQGHSKGRGRTLYPQRGTEKSMVVEETVEGHEPQGLRRVTLGRWEQGAEEGSEQGFFSD